MKMHIKWTHKDKEEEEEEKEEVVWKLTRRALTAAMCRRCWGVSYRAHRLYITIQFKK